jgi:betaine-homocysteine S-methyltransferase
MCYDYVTYTLTVLIICTQGQSINQAACDIAKEVAAEGGALVAGGISQTPSYLSGLGKAAVQSEFRKQVQVFVENKVDFLICEVRAFF